MPLQVLKTSLQVLKNAAIGLQNFFFFFLTRFISNRVTKEGHFPNQFGKWGKTLLSLGEKDICPFSPKTYLKTILKFNYNTYMCLEFNSIYIIKPSEKY